MKWLAGGRGGRGGREGGGQGGGGVMRKGKEFQIFIFHEHGVEVRTGGLEGRKRGGSVMRERVSYFMNTVWKGDGGGVKFHYTS